MERLIDANADEGRTHGPAFVGPDGKLADSRSYDESFKVYLERIQAGTELIEDKENVRERYGLFRTPRKTAQSRIQRAGFGQQFQDSFNRWKTAENAGTRRVKRAMRDHYAEAALLMPVTWVGSYVL